MADGKPIPRIGVDWNDDLFICYDARPDDALNQLHSGINSTPEAVNLHWLDVRKGVVSASSAGFIQVASEYGVRAMRVVTGTDTSAIALFGSDALGNADFATGSAPTYTASLWIRATVGSGVSMSAWIVDDTPDLLVGTVFTISLDWQRVDITFTPDAPTDKVAFFLYKNGDATNVDYQATGFMIVEGSTAPNGFNTGNATDLYDNISEDVQKWDAKFGRNRWTDPLPAEGIANLTLDNTTRRYSPEYSGSPLYGSMLPRLLMTIDVQHPSFIDNEWERLFAGWTNRYEATPGKNRAQQASITAEQGMFRLSNMPFRAVVSGETTADAIIRQIIMSGFMSTATPHQMLLNRAKLNAAYFPGEYELMSLETGVSTLNPTGEEWGVDVPAIKVLRDVMDVEEGFFWISRTGKVFFFNRYHYLVESPSIALSLDQEPVTGAKYSYGQYYFNQVKVGYKPPSDRTGIVWETREAIKVRYTKRGRLVTIPVKFEYEEGKKMTVSAVNPFDGSADASTFTAATRYGDDRSAQISVTFTGLENGQGKIQIKNTKREAVFVNVILRGTITETYGGQTVEVTTEDGLRGGVAKLERNPKVIHDEDEATNLANHLLAVYQEPFGVIESITLKNKNDLALAYIEALRIGTYLDLSEYQTGHAGDYVIIGENYNWQPGKLEATYTLYPQFRADQYWICGESTLGVDTYAGY